MTESTNGNLWLVVGIFLLALIVALLVWFKSDAPESTPNGAGPQSAPLNVSVKRLKSETVAVYEDLPGRTVAFQVAEIRPQVTGILKDRLFEEGSYVEEGTALYQIDPAVYQASYNSAVAALEKTKANLKSLEATKTRFKKLVKIDAVSQQEYDDNNSRVALAAADIGIASAAVAQAKINLDFTNVYAPISGIIGKSQVTKGALITANQNGLLATITQLDPIYVDMTIPSSELEYLRKNFNDLHKIPVLIFENEQKKDPSHTGVFKFHEVTVDPATSSVQVRAEFSNKNRVLLPGLYVQAALQLTLHDALLIPQRASQRLPNGKLSVWVVDENNMASTKEFTEERAFGDQWLVATGMNAGDVIVTESMMLLKSGMSVNSNKLSD